MEDGEKKDKGTSGKHELVFSPAAKTETEKKNEKTYALIKHHGKRARSIRVNLWLTFMLMTALMLGVLWVYELIFYSTSYISNEQNTLKKAGDAFAIGYYECVDDTLGGSTGELEPYAYVSSYAREHGVNIVVFTAETDEAGNIDTEVIHSSSVTGTKASAPEGEMLTFYMDLVYGKEPTRGYVSNTTDYAAIDEALVVYGWYSTIKDYGEYYIYMSSSLPAFGAAQNTIAGQLVIISGAFMLIAVVIAYVGSGVAARPMRNLTKKVVASSAAGGKREPLDTDTRLSEVNELSAAFNKAFDDVESNNRFRRDLLANVSHDMKTPLTMIRAYGEMIRDISGGNKEKSVKQAQIIIDETDRLTALINEVVELSKLESGVIELNKCVFDVSDRLNETVHRFRIMEETKGYEFTADVEEGVLVNADGERIDRVIYNLVGNAMNYTGEDKTVSVRCFKAGDLARVEISDSGKGMTEEELASVWDKYYRLAQDRRNVIGSGLGLSIVKSILDLHRVTYGVISEKGNGSTFWFTLPLAEEVI